MTAAGARSRVTPLFIDASPGKRFCLLHEPPRAVECTRALLYVHPFAEEMNKARRMAALQARRLADAGCMVLLMDLYGCGDSEGVLDDARWEVWKRDIDCARAWLQALRPVPISLWGLRLGAALAVEAMVESTHAYGPLLLWHPVTNGETYLTQFLRLRVASEVMLGDSERRSTTSDLRKELQSGNAIEVSGYMLNSSLARSIDAVRLGELAVAGAQVHWFEIAAESPAQPSPAAQRVRDHWCGQGMEVSLSAVQGEPFWTTLEIAECPALLELSTDAVKRFPQ